MPRKHPNHGQIVQALLDYIPIKNIISDLNVSHDTVRLIKKTYIDTIRVLKLRPDPDQESFFDEWED